MSEISYTPFNDVTDPDAAVAAINTSLASLFPPSALNPFVTLADIAGGGNTIYTADGTLTGNRIVSLGGFNLQFGAGVSQVSFTPTLVNIGNASTVSQRLVRIGQGTAFMDLGSLTISTTEAAIYFNQVTPNNSNYSLKSIGTTGVTLNAPTSGNLILAIGNTNYMLVQPNTFQFIAAPATASANTPYTFTVPNNTNQGATQEKIAFRIAASGYNWLAGNITLQRHINVESIVYSATGASVFTDVVMFQVAEATVGANVTITRNWAARLLGNVAVGNRLFVGDVLGTTAPTAFLDISAYTNGANGINSIRIRAGAGVGPTAPNQGDISFNGANFLVRAAATRTDLMGRVLVNTQNINFANTASGASDDETMTVTGAAVGDSVALSVPVSNQVLNQGVCYTAFVSAANTVTIRFSNFSGVAVNPPSGNVFKATVFKN